jgi:hypothetical protein
VSSQTQGTSGDDMLTSMLGLGEALQNSTWGAIVAQLVAAASIDPGMRATQTKSAEHHLNIDVQAIERARQRGEIAEDTDTRYAAQLFIAPLFYQHLHASESIDAKWITKHVDRTVALLRVH